MTDSNHAQTLERLLETNRSLSAPLEVEQILQSMTALAAELTSSELASILKYEPESGKLRFIAMPWFYRDALREQRVSVDRSIAGWAYREAKPVIVLDVQADPRHDRSVDQATDFETRSILAVPVIYRGEPIGVLEAVNKTGQVHYTEEDLSLLETLASQAAIAMETSRTHSQIQHSLDKLSQLDRMKNDFIAIALSNLLKNSIIFTNPGGHIQISADEVPDFVKISVSDDGIGIPACNLPRIFERFYQVESHLTRRHGGMGLGLSVPKVMGGRIWAESVEGKGSQFIFLLPLEPDQPDASSKAFVT